MPKYNKGSLHQAYSQDQIKWKGTQTNSSKIRNKTLFPYQYNTVLEILTLNNKTRKGDQMDTNWEGGIQSNAICG